MILCWIPAQNRFPIGSDYHAFYNLWVW